MAPKNQNTWVGDVVTDRQVIPRWHSPWVAAANFERGISSVRRIWSERAKHWYGQLSLKAELEPSDHNIQAVEETNFMFTGSMPEGGVLESKFNQISFSIASLNNPDERMQLENRTGRIPNPVRIEIARLRSTLNAHPHQANIWSELARNFTIAGQDEKAKKAMRCALELSPHSTYIRRVASRMYLHMDDPGLALKVLRTHPAVKFQPHMLAAEIAVTSSIGRSSVLTKVGENVLNTGDFLPSQVTELAAAIGTLELKHGKHVKARHFFEKAFISPNENVVAQAQWANRHDKRIIVPESAWDLPNAFEARTLKARAAQDWNSVLTDSISWLEDELYSTRPATLGSFVCFDELQNRQSEKIATIALSSTTSDFALLNNRSVARSYLGNVNGALSDIKKALRSKEGQESPFLLATLGLLAYRTNDLSLGDICYGSAVELFFENNQKLSAVLAMLYWLRETSRFIPSRTSEGIALVRRRIGTLTNEKRDPEIYAMIGHVEGLLNNSIPLEAENTDRVFPEMHLENILSLFSSSLSNNRLDAYLERILA